MYVLGEDKKTLNDVDVVTFSELKMTEKDLEEILVENIHLLDDDDNDEENSDSMVVVGRQVRNEGNGRSDLTAIDKNGNLVLIEIKRDVKDIKARSEAFTFQAIRYVASYSKINTIDELVDKIYVPYLEKNPPISIPVGQNLRDYATDKIHRFLNQHNINDLSGKQRIILVAGDFDEQTLSAAAWLCKNGINISCFRVTPNRWNDQILIDVKQLLPLKDYVLDIAEPGSSNNAIAKSPSKSIQRARLPKINALVREGILFVGDRFTAKDNPTEEVELQSNCKIKIVSTNLSSLKEGDITTLQQWLKVILDWDAVDTYNFTVVKNSKNSANNGKLIFDIRQQWLDSLEPKA